MQTIGPYRLVRALGQCPVGGVWSAVDGANNGVTVALLASAAAHDPGWRNAFAATANSLAQSGEVPLIGGDYSGPTPWIASSARDGAVLGRVFVALGMDYQPATDFGEAGEPAAGEAQTAMATSSPPAATVSAEPVSSSPQPVSGAPAEPTAPIRPAASPYSYEPEPARSPHTVSPFSVPPAGPPPRRSNGLLIGLVVLVVALLVGGGSVVAVAMWPDGSQPDAQESIGSTVQEPTFPPPSQPGVDPPLEGEWPADWPTFEEEPVSQMQGLIGDLDGQAFQVPAGWECPQVSAEGTFAHYTCGPDGDPAEIGGDLTIRFCPDPCDAAQRDQLRAEVEAWGLRWVRDFSFRSWAETTEIDDEERYGLVVVAYYRTTPEGRIDRQLVLRMTAPIEQADDVRKVANSVREAIT